jgi:hypothetical protein
MDGWSVVVFLGWVAAVAAFLYHVRGQSRGLEDTKRRAKYERVP